MKTNLNNTIEERLATLGQLSLKELDQLESDLLMLEQFVDDELDNAETNAKKNRAELAHAKCIDGIHAVRHRLYFMHEQNRKRIPALTAYEIDQLERYMRSEHFAAHEALRLAQNTEERALARERLTQADRAISQIEAERCTRLQDQTSQIPATIAQ